MTGRLEGVQRVAVMDIGSNSVRLMVADVDHHGALTVLDKQLHSTRMAQGLDATGRLSDAAMNRTADAVTDFWQTARQIGAQRCYAFATAAVREAVNRDVFLKMVHKRTAILVDVLSGEQEALAGFVCSGLSGGYHGMIDIGGASTELAVGQDVRLLHFISMKLGAVRLSERYPLGDVADPLGLEAMCQIAAGTLAGEAPPVRKAAAVLPGLIWNGVGGTITTLAAMELQLIKYDSQRVQGYPLRREAVTHWRSWLATLSLSERRMIVGLPASRADIILAGVVILEQFMEALDAPVVYVSDRDNLEGYLLLRMREEGWLQID